MRERWWGKKKELEKSRGKTSGESGKNKKTHHHAAAALGLSALTASLCAGVCCAASVASSAAASSSADTDGEARSPLLLCRTPTGRSRSTSPSRAAKSRPSAAAAAGALRCCPPAAAAAAAAAAASGEYQIRILESATTALSAWSRASSHFSLDSFRTACSRCLRWPSPSARSASLRKAPTLSTQLSGSGRWWGPPRSTPEARAEPAMSFF